MTNQERRERRREAALKGAATRAAKAGQVVNHQDEPPQLLDPARLETAEEQSRRARAAEEKRLVNLRALIRKARRSAGNRTSTTWHTRGAGTIRPGAGPPSRSRPPAASSRDS